MDIETNHVEANGLRFAYLEAGRGPLALLLHGFPDTPHGWAELIPALCDAGYRVVAPFTRGYAPTQVPDTRVTVLEELAEDALALIEVLGHESAVVVGHDWGAATAYLATAMNPARVDKLLTVGIPHPAVLRPSLGLLWSARHFIGLRLPGALWRMRRNDFAMVDALYRRWSPTWEFAPEETAAVKECYRNPESLDAALGYYRGAKPGRVPAPMREKIAVDTMVVAGLDDPALEVGIYEEARRRFTGEYEVVALPGGHFVHRESPTEFVEAAVRFLARDEAAADAG